jgi:acylphosphatase
MKTLRLIITGTVQGVLFRKYIEENANKIGIRGYIRNLEDGRVEVVIEGTEDKIEPMIDICKKGSPHSQVRQVEMMTLPNQSFKDFRIMRI